jgi:DNA-directed RNA polymerase specialized sigma24 family protein
VTVDIEQTVIRSAVPTPAADLEAKERAEAIRTAVDGLPQTQREAVMLYYFSGYAEELATLCDKARRARSWSGRTSKQCAELVGQALAFDREAIASIEQVVGALEAA